MVGDEAMHETDNNQEVGSRRVSRSASMASDRQTDTQTDSRRPKSVSSVSVTSSARTGHRRSDSRVSAATSGSLIDDPTLYEEVDIPLPQELSGPGQWL